MEERAFFFFFNRVNFACLLFAIIKDCFEIWTAQQF